MSPAIFAAIIAANAAAYSEPSQTSPEALGFVFVIVVFASFFLLGWLVWTTRR